MAPMLSFGQPNNQAASSRRLLIVFDGGNAPGYSSVAVALTEEAVRRNYEVWAASEGFRSLNAMEEGEEDLLDRAWGLEPDSRLGCQAIVADADLVVEIPKYTINHARENH